MSGSASRLFRPVVASWNWLRMAWDTQPVLVVSALMGIGGKWAAHTVWCTLTSDACPIPVQVQCGYWSDRGQKCTTTR